MPAFVNLPSLRQINTFQLVKSFSTIAILFFLGSCPAFALSGQNMASLHVNERDSANFHTHETTTRFIVENYVTKDSNYRSRIIDLISYSLGFYTEELILWGKQKVTFRHPAEQQFTHLNAIVRHSLELYAHPAKDSFWGFSGRLEKQLLLLHKMEGYAIDYANTSTETTANTINHEALQKKVIELKNIATREVEEFIDEHPEPIDPNGFLLNPQDDDSLTAEDQLLQSLEKASRTDVALLIDSLFELDKVPHGLIGEINTRIQELENAEPEPTFRKNQPLDPIAHLIETHQEKDDAQLEIKLPKAKKSKVPEKAEPTPPTATIDFNSRVLELLEENNRLMSKYNDRFDFMQSQINELKEEQQTVSGESEARLQGQIDELHAMIKDLGQEKSSGSTPSAADEKFKPVAVIFERNSHDITIFHKTLLNEVSAGLMKNPAYKIMITGFADALGDKKYNILLSQKRAQSVRNYLAEKGIDSSRLVVNYYGDNQSQTSNPLDRKVEIEWLVDYSSEDR